MAKTRLTASGPDDQRGGKRPDLRCWGLTCVATRSAALTTQPRHELGFAVLDGRRRSFSGNAALPARDLPALHTAGQSQDVHLGPQHTYDLARSITHALAPEHRLDRLRHRAAAIVSPVDGVCLPALLARRRQRPALSVRRSRCPFAESSALAAVIGNCSGDGISAVLSRTHRPVVASTMPAWPSAAITACVSAVVRVC